MIQDNKEVDLYAETDLKVSEYLMDAYPADYFKFNKRKYIRQIYTVSFGGY
jgi:hypothetical protein